MRTLANDRGTFNDDDFGSIPYGLPPGDENNGCTAGLDDSTCEPTDNGSSEPQQHEQPYWESGAEVESLRREMERYKAELKALHEQVDDVWIERTYGLRGDRGFQAWWKLTIFFSIAGQTKCFIGEGPTLEDAELSPLLAASAALVVADRTGKAVARG